MDLNAVERKHKNVKAVNTDRVYANTALALLSKLFITLARLTKSHNRISQECRLVIILMEEEDNRKPCDEARDKLLNCVKETDCYKKASDCKWKLSSKYIEYTYI